MEILVLVGRTTVLWFVALGVFRFMGKRTLGKMGPFDFVVAIMISEAVAIGMEDSHTPLIHVIAITAALGVLQWLLTWVNLRFRWLEKLTQGTATPVIVNGTINKKVLLKERLSNPDLLMELRLNETTLKDVTKAQLEPTGQVSIEKKPKSRRINHDENG